MATTTRPASRLLATTLRPEQSRVLALVALLLVAMLLPLAGPLILARFVDGALSGRPVGALTTLAAAYLVLAVLGEVLQLAVTWASVHLAWRAGNRLREELADHALHLELAWHGDHSAGVLIERIDGDVEALTQFFSNVVLHVIGNAILVAGVLVISTVIDWRAGLALTVFAALAVAVMIRLRVAAVPAHDAEREANARLYGDLEERLGGLEDIRANGAGPHAVHRLQANSARSWRTARRASLHGDSAYALSATAFAAGSVATLAVGILLLDRGIITLGAVFALFRYAQLLRQPLERIAEQLRELQKALAGATRAARLLATERTLVDGPLGPEALPSGPLSVDLEGVTLTYAEGTVAVRDLDLHLAPGTHLGVVGRTGSGKTTLGRLLLRFWDATEGTVRVGGVDVADLQLGALRRRIAVVTQDVELLRASVRENLTLYGRWPATDERLVEVLGEVGLGGWLAGLPEGIDTQLAGTGGLSSGEAQLLAFARAFLAEPDLIVLDEASSRLDPATEATMAAAMHRLLEGRTAVIVAHRLATLEEVDEIAVLDGGRLVEHGERSRLAADPTTRYARLLRASEAAHTGLLAEAPGGGGS
ncbi:MAG TPA: ABC transporter ATP-binding protein [Acidimicrobiales bacterium]|nr:ABC transporter ATP-binding protein [Acidimicrobiales bacterium]